MIMKAIPLIDKGHRGVAVTLVDRLAREVKIKIIPRRTAKFVEQACIELLQGEVVNSITFDNGKEFSNHQVIAKALSTNIYFAKPYHSWERGTNENANGLIRQFLPKSLALEEVSEDETRIIAMAIEENLNNRLRKVLGYLTPLEIKSRFIGVALRC